MTKLATSSRKVNTSCSDLTKFLNLVVYMPRDKYFDIYLNDLQYKTYGVNSIFQKINKKISYKTYSEISF